MSAPSDGARADARKRLAESTGGEPDDRLICCPECTSVFEAEDHTLDVDWLAGVIADAKAEERERVAAAIEAVAGEHGGRMMPHASASDCRRCHLSEAARIARAVVTS